MIDHQLALFTEQIRQRFFALLAFENIFFFDFFPRQRSALLGPIARAYA